MEPEVKGSNNEDVQKTPEIKPEHGTAAVFTEEAKQVSSSSSNSSSDHEEKGSPPAPPPRNSSDGNGSSTSMEPSEMKSPPPVQTMGPPPGYDPNRIPATIFSTKIGNPAEWSAASNESLFSLHMGNSSFSRDYSVLFGKSGELPKFEDWNNNNNSQTSNNPFAKSGELPRLEEWNSSNYNNFRTVPEPKSSNDQFGSNLPPLMEVPSHEETCKSGEFSLTIECKDTGDYKSSKVENHHVPAVEAAKKPPLPESSHLSSSSNPLSLPSPSRLSDVSGHSSSSFAFPVLASDSGKNDSLKVAPEKPEQQQQQQQQQQEPAEAQASKEAPNVSETRWFACFSCWPRFC